MTKWVLIIFLRAATVQVDMPSEQACRAAAGIAMSSLRRQGYEHDAIWACLPTWGVDE